MRTVDTKWQDLAAGLSRIEQLERELHNEWVPLVEQARLRRIERAQGAWQDGQEASRRRFEKELAAWRARYSERCRDVEDQLRVWDRMCSDEQQRLTARAQRGGMSALAALAVLLAGLLALAAPMSSYIVAAAVALPIVLAPALLSGWRLARLRANKPSADHADDPEPQPRVLEPEPTPERRNSLPLDIVQQWWGEVSYDDRARRSAATHGDAGVDIFWNHLAARLPNQYVAVRDLLVRRALDVDVLVVGPTGIWLFEVKHWSGEITCRQGSWRRQRTWGYEASEDGPIQSFDEQWLREVDAVKETLRRRLPPQDQQGSLVSAIRGGIVFTHPKATWNIDKSCKSGWGSPTFWPNFLLDSPVLPQLTPERLLRVLDALLTWAHRLDPSLDGASSNSAELARGLFSNAAQTARSYVAV